MHWKIAILILTLATPLLAQDAPAPPEDAEAMTRRVRERVEEMRGLRFEREVRIGFHDRDELLGVIQDKVGHELETESFERRLRGFRALGLLPADWNAAEGITRFLAGQVAGFYDPEAKELRLVRENDSAQSDLMAMMGMTEEVILAHELVHVLQDQHFGLQGFLEGVEDLDVAQARRTLVEGDATYHMIQLDRNPMLALNYGMMPSSKRKIAGMLEMARRAGLSGEDLEGMGADGLLETPAAIVDPLLFDYADGFRFVKALLASVEEGKGLARLDAAFAAPPLSTEQIMDPEKYFGPEPDWPTAVLVPDLTRELGEGTELVWQNTLGELLLRTWLEEQGTRRVRRTHQGWDGDRVAVYARPEGPDVLIWATTWDSDQDADEFERAMRAAIARRNPDAALEESDPGLLRGENEGLGCAMLRRGREVFLVEGVPSDRLDGVLLKLLLSTRLEVKTPLAN